MGFAERLRHLRVMHGLSQLELAKKMGLSKSRISMYELGAREPSLEMLEIIGDYFNVDIDYLLGRDEESTYYLEPEVAELAKEIYQRKELRELFEAARSINKEDLEFVIRMIEGLKK